MAHAAPGAQQAAGRRIICDSTAPSLIYGRGRPQAPLAYLACKEQNNFKGEVSCPKE
jgi:hypothetical protein